MAEEEPRFKLQAPRWLGQVNKTGFLDLVSKYRERVLDKKTGLPFEQKAKKAEGYSLEKLAFETGWGLKLGLKVFFPICSMVFAFSFLWDFHGVIRACSIAGIIGFSTNWVAIKMLFWPRENRPIFGQGLIPSQRDQLIEKVADEVLKNLINEELILEKIDEIGVVSKFSGAMIEKLQGLSQDPEFKADLRNMVLTYVGDITSNPEFRKRVSQRAEESLEEVAGTRFRTWMVRRLKDVWREPLIRILNQEIDRLDETLEEGLDYTGDFVERLPHVLNQRREAIDKVLTTMLIGLVREVDVREIVLEQLSTITTEQLEKGFREFSDDKLSFITLLGGVLGVIGGFAIVWWPSILIMGGLLITVFLADMAIYPLMGSRFWPKKR